MAEIMPFFGQLGSMWWLMMAILGFMFFWPIGLAMAAFALWRCRGGRLPQGLRFADMLQHSPMAEFFANTTARAPSSGNIAFDEYHDETLMRLDDELKSFEAFRDRLRMAKDHAEFDQFMAEMRRTRQSWQTATA
ncbi:MAG: DUF2852 domain-containing protein [Pseudomonadota bacterium]